MKPRRVYIDTSVVGGCFDPEFRAASLRLFERFRTGGLIAVVSDLMELELRQAPESVREVLAGIPAEHREDVLVTSEARALAERYLAAGVVGRAMRSDAEHIATATLHEVDVLASWNFRHIVNPRRAGGYNAVNQLEGCVFLQIRTPAEVLRYGE